ncbi:hypothetical protein [Oscillatoria nigro-viridis]|nr:hypothetical protein [Oscillatoria nigro-viridis]
MTSQKDEDLLSSRSRPQPTSALGWFKPLDSGWGVNLEPQID